jgi:two-component system cell cycle sensor histidine kinase/response regulator CckA
MKTPPYKLHREYDQTNARLARPAWEALRVVRKHKGAPIHPAITEVIMPQMGGEAIAEWPNPQFPDPESLFTSGYTEDVLGHHGVLKSGMAFLAKPYTPAIPTHKVRKLLDAP